MSGAIDEGVARQAAEWFLLLQSDEATAGDREKADRWRRAAPGHEEAWQRAERIMSRVQALPPGLAMPVLERGGRRRRIVGQLALLIAASPLAWLGWREADSRGYLADHRTATGERRDLVLADGTALSLNTATAIDVRFDADLRLVRLVQGEILVTTAGAAASRPFFVATRQGRIQALGTRFLVRDAGPHCLVAVFEGATEIRPAAASFASPLVIEAGQQCRFDAAGAEPVEATSPRLAGWSKGLLQVDDMRLADFLADLGRYRPGHLGWDPAVADLRITGSFQLRDTDAVLASLAQALPVRIGRRTNYWVTVLPVEDPAAG